MPYRQNAFKQGHYYHIYNRGAGQERIFFNPGNYEYCLRLMKKHLSKHEISVIAYCLMPTHYHFLLRQNGETPISDFISIVFNAYVQAVNRQQERKGTLFEGRFKHIEVNHNSYLLNLCRYIHANPVKACLAPTLEQWPYSNYPEWVNLRSGTLIDRDFVNGFFLNNQDYKKFVLDYLLGLEDLPKDIKSYLLIK